MSTLHFSDNVINASQHRSRNFSDELRQRLPTVWKALEQHIAPVATSVDRVCQCKRQPFWTQLANKHFKQL